MLLMPLFFRQLFRLLFFTRPKSGFGLSPNPLASFVFLLVNRPARSCPVCLALPTAIATYPANAGRAWLAGLAVAGGFDDFR